MNCERIEAQLDAIADREIRGVTAWRVQRHSRNCASCADKLRLILRIGDCARSWRDVAPSNEWLQGSVAAMAESDLSERIGDSFEAEESVRKGITSRHLLASRTLIVRLAGDVCLTAAVAVGFPITGSRTTEVKTAHGVTWVIQLDGRRLKIMETWYRNGWYREWFEGRVNLITGNARLWSYDSSADLVTSSV